MNNIQKQAYDSHTTLRNKPLNRFLRLFSIIWDVLFRRMKIIICPLIHVFGKALIMYNSMVLSFFNLTYLFQNSSKSSNCCLDKNMISWFGPKYLPTCFPRGWSSLYWTRPAWLVTRLARDSNIFWLNPSLLFSLVSSQKFFDRLNGVPIRSYKPKYIACI